MEKIQFRRDTAANWKKYNPILSEGELGIEMDTKLRKLGDGSTAWNELEYLAAENIVQELGDSKNAVISQKATTEFLNELKNLIGTLGSGKIPTMKLSEIDTPTPNDIKESGNSYYRVIDDTMGNFVVGVLFTFSDNMQHVLSQVFITHYNDPGTWNSHRDDEIYVYYRSYNIGGMLDIPRFSWTDWKKLSNSGQNVIPFATSEVYGTVKLGSDIEQSIAAQEPQSVAARTYPIQKDKDGKLVVNVPWTATGGDGATSPSMLIFDGIVSGDITAKSNSTVNNDGIYWAENEGRFVCKDGDEYYLGWMVDDRYKGLPIDYANCSLFVQSPRTAVSIGAQVHAIYAKVAKKQPTGGYKTVLEKVGEVDEPLGTSEIDSSIDSLEQQI